MSQGIFGNLNLYARALNASWKRNEALTANIANVDTPNYKRKDVEFETLLQQATENDSFRGYRTNEKHIAIGTDDIQNSDIKIATDNKTSIRIDGNNVDIESEMALLAKNNITYNALIQKVNGEFSKLKTAINEGR